MRIYLSLLLALLLPALPGIAQPSKPGIGRISPSAIQINSDNQSTTWWLLCKDTTLLKDYIIKKQVPLTILQRYPATGLVVVKTTRKVIDSLLAVPGLLQLVDRPRIPTEELSIEGFDPTANQINAAHNFFETLNGQGTVLSVKENRFDTTDIDFKGRYLRTHLVSNTFSGHATIMGTIAAGGGNSHYTSKGAAWAAGISSASFESLLPEPDAVYQQYAINVQNHSYGTGIENYYGADALAYDASVSANPLLLHVFSAGNSGNVTSTSGPYQNIPAFANLTGSFKMAKNIITVGATDSLHQLEIRSSRGPTYDGRLKPDLVAFGQDGSSGAAAIVSGAALLLQQYYKQIRSVYPNASLVKAFLINSADDMGAPGPDFQYGYGNVNVLRALEAMSWISWMQNRLAPGQTDQVTIALPAGLKKFKVTLCWTDPPGDPAASKALVNDLDLTLTNTLTGEILHPWVASHFPHADSLKKAAVRKVDTLNNTEQITIDNPAGGTYQIAVKGTHITTAYQDYAVAFQMDTANRFRWYYPGRKDNLLNGSSNTLRWSSSFDVAAGQLSYSTDNGSSWKPVGAAALTQSWFKWTTPDTVCIAKLRMSIGGQHFDSDPFTISGQLNAVTGFNCADSFLLSWNKSANTKQFTVYELGDQYLHPILTTSDTNVVLKKSAHPALHYAVATSINGNTSGIKSFAFDYTAQGVDCYIRNFLAVLGESGAIRINAELGTLYQIKNIVLEKLLRKGSEQLKQVTAPTLLLYEWTDEQLQQGENTYRLKLQLQNGQWVYSEPQTVFALKEGAYLAYPNPVAATGTLKVYAADFLPALIQLYNVQGQLMKQQPLTEFPQAVSLSGLKNGLYFLVVSKNGKQLYRKAVVVR
ncbi:S8 family serine peptidase [Pseudoflavitalea sp. G-6-1-2]|uniref:S8 family serine peptidase n=1 Tax=Pseudoflavitalea sp. G-6-1-2 TaxID=2728841 RepID=UPI00146A1EEA|nr:S8 family serine peptidase [Pseudoflavitalea sp. G-6-1-2]NML23049.1 S8 family serine peptidase [Pseudoflavitalea sp. G-6-1-2]